MATEALRRLLRALPLGLLLAATLPAALPAQGAPSPHAPAPQSSGPVSRSSGPADAARAYLRAVEARAWERAARSLHPRALAELRRTLDIMLEADEENRLRDALARGLDARPVSEAGGRELYVAAMRALQRESPGIVQAMSDRNTEVLGAVAEGDSLAHAVYRSQWRLSGSEPEIEVLTLARSREEEWRVADSPDLGSLRPALRGLLLPGPDPPSPPRGRSERRR